MLQGWNNLAGNARKLKLLSASSIPFPGPDTVPALGLREAVWGGREGRRDRVEGGLAAAVQPSRLHHPTPCPSLPTALPLQPPGQELWRRDTCEEKDDDLEGLPPQRPQIALPDSPKTLWLPLTHTHTSTPDRTDL